MWSLSPKMAFVSAKGRVSMPLLLVLCLLGSAAICRAGNLPANAVQAQGRQESQPSDEAKPSQEEGKYRTTDILEPEPIPGQTQGGDRDQSDAIDAIPVPIEPMDPNRTLGGQTFVDDVFKRPRNRWGFVLSAYQAHTSDISADNQPKQSSGITAFMPRTFFNFGKRKSLFHVDLGAGYRYYNQRRESNAWDYQGSAEYTLHLSRRTTFQLADQFTSSFNDAWSFLSLYSPLDYDPLSSNEVIFNRQRINRNSVRAELSQQITTKARYEIFGGHRWFDYRKNTLTDSSAIEYGGNFNYQITKWLHVASGMTAYFNLVEGSEPDARIYHVQFGGLEFRPTKGWRIWAGGGLDISDYAGENRTSEHVSAGIGYVETKTSFSLTYQRGFTSAIGISRLLLSDVASAEVGRRISNWLNANLQSYYYRSYEAGVGGRIETLSGGGGLEFGLRRDLILTMNAFYQNQRTRNFSVQGLGLSRLTGYLGLQYMWPARKQNEY